MMCVLGGFYCNKLAIEAARKHDMGMFIISPTDKGGQLYMPPKKFGEAIRHLRPLLVAFERAVPEYKGVRKL